MVEMLTPIWQRVLQRSSVGLDDHFFNTGGNIKSADMLFAEIARECGRELPSATIYHAPTIAALASLLEQPTLPPFSPFVLMKGGTKTPPIFIVHGLAGTVQFFELAKHIQTENPIYGIQAKGVDGLEEPFDRIEDMAEFYLNALRELQPRGPYILIGYSFGGLVALEMAQHLSKDEKKAALLVLVGAYPHPRYLSPGQRLRLMAQRTRNHIIEMKQRSLRGAISYFFRGLERRLPAVGVYSRGARLPEMSRLSLAQTTLRVKEKAYVALASYRPRTYSGKIKFVKSERDPYFPADPAAVWANLADEFEVETVPGGHLDMVMEDFKSLAAVLTRYMTYGLSQG
jgi:acetoacetyl-CoA synthetase